jgi:hypothetical protein
MNIKFNRNKYFANICSFLLLFQIIVNKNTTKKDWIVLEVRARLNLSSI